MDYLNREILINQMNAQLKELMDHYQLEDIGIYEEEGAGDDYYLGYTVRKNGEVYMINMPYMKDAYGNLGLKNRDWTIQSDEGEKKGFHNLDEVFDHIDKGFQ
ncbi:DUF5634 family protein [Bacillus sporothermodurans]|uniref:DUF5634 family protein n=2 Tax=Heyndrickxia sporothermodurans TaxID=46224 RepID=A0AB37H865_9BACI|nr:DUF5634 family protein [Heyndrickxia sporothermodurans]MBL5772457.1 DUF5634 family protein [Heyndrickxia sporothermodurans]MBL5774810.1 DUF5634 family protein [Heyndrickxia sporothermodurans]MBL5792732.1 DUF5634 family protein [Heyndrickxia sporothermodurans]MBL5796116.1 DUF5634 family protein [Heyndrickxia sporothermodurans]MBL5807023.1 DUF5634 family protein [Heyndrickxia sporothermodurans]